MRKKGEGRSGNERKGEEKGMREGEEGRSNRNEGEGGGGG